MNTLTVSSSLLSVEHDLAELLLVRPGVPAVKLYFLACHLIFKDELEGVPAFPLEVWCIRRDLNPIITVIRVVFGDRESNLVRITMFTVVCRLEGYSSDSVLGSPEVKLDPCVLVFRVILEKLIEFVLSIA